jgi:hypothetical protein
MWPAFPAADYYESSASLSIIGATFPYHLNRPSPVHMPDSNALVRLPIAVFTLAFRKLIPTPRSGYILPVTPCKLPYFYSLHSRTNPYV